MEKTSRKEAISKGMSYYFTGIPCKYGHIAKRHVTGCGCVECVREFANRPESKIKRSIYQKRKIPREKARIYAEKYHKKNRKMCLKKMHIRNAVYYQKNKDKIKKQTLAYQAEHATERTNYKKIWRKNRIKTDPVFKMAIVCRRMLHRALGVAGQVKYKRTKDYLPYTYAQLVERLESKFKIGMSWNNYGEWHIDHKIPIAWFIKKGITDPAIINALDNLQPLWAKENMSKGCKIIKDQTNV